jgi:hypothetical protein
VKAKGLLSCMSTTPIPFLEASHSRKKVFVKSGRARIGFVHMTSFNSWNDQSVVGVQVKAFFLRRVVRGAAIFP